MMKQRSITLTLTTLTMMALAVFSIPSTVRADGAKQLSGVGAYAAAGTCTDAQGQGASYILSLTGDLSGCDYVFVEEGRCTAGGAYYETGTETFVGNYNGGFGTFKTQYVFTAKYRDCPNFIGEINGRCEHPIVLGTGTGVFEGVRGRFDMRDDVANGTFPYRAHLLFPR